MERRLLVLALVVFGALACAGESGGGSAAYVGRSPTLTAMRALDLQRPLQLNIGMMYPGGNDDRGGLLVWVGWLADWYLDVGGCCSGPKWVGVGDSIFD